MRKVLIVAAIAAVGTALLSCGARRPIVAEAPPLPPAAYAPSGPVARAPLPPPVGYAPPPLPMADARPPAPPYGNDSYARSEPQTAANLVWRASPRWATVKKKERAVAKPDPDARFKAAQAKAEEVGVENLSKEDIDGLSLAQIKELRGY